MFAAMIVVPFGVACRPRARRGASARSVAFFAMLAAPAATVRGSRASLLVSSLRAIPRVPRARGDAVPSTTGVARTPGARAVGESSRQASSLRRPWWRCSASPSWSRAGARGRCARCSAPSPCVFASPYGLSLRRLLPIDGRRIRSSRSSSSSGRRRRFPTFVGLPFFLIAAGVRSCSSPGGRATCALRARRACAHARRRPDAQRSIAWFSYTALLLLPRLSSVPGRSGPVAPTDSNCVRFRPSRSVGARSSSTLLPPRRLAQQVRALLPADRTAAPCGCSCRRSDARVVATEGTADWLLYEIPELQRSHRLRRSLRGPLAAAVPRGPGLPQDSRDRAGSR